MSLNLFGKPPQFASTPMSAATSGHRASETNFLAFTDAQSQHANSKEFMSAEAVTKFERTQHRVPMAKNADGSPDWAVQLDDTFAKPGVWQFKYKNIAPPITQGTGYIDMGVPENRRVELATGYAEELMSGKSMARTNDFEYANYGYKEQGIAPAAKKEAMSGQCEFGWHLNSDGRCQLDRKQRIA